MSRSKIYPILIPFFAKISSKLLIGRRKLKVVISSVHTTAAAKVNFPIFAKKSNFFSRNFYPKNTGNIIRTSYRGSNEVYFDPLWVEWYFCAFIGNNCIVSIINTKDSRDLEDQNHVTKYKKVSWVHSK